MALDHMGLDAQRKFGTSRLGMGLAESRAVDMDERRIKNSVQEQKRTERLGRRAYRAALRGQDASAYLQGLDALQGMRAVNGTSGAGIKMAGVAQGGIEQGLANTRAQIDNFNGKTLDNNGALVPRQGSRILGNGSGLTPQDAKTSSNGGEWVDVSGKPMATTLEVRGAAPSATPLVKPSGNSLAASAGGYHPGLSARIGALQAKWQNEARANDPSRQQATYEAANGTPAQQAATLRPPAAPSAFTPEDRGLVSDLQSASRILRDYRSSQNNELTQSRVNPTGQSPMLGLASRLFGGSVDSGPSFASGPTPSLSAPASRLVSDPSARPVAINSPPPTSSSRLNVKWGEWENTSPEYLIPREKARAKKQAQDAKNRELTTRKSNAPGLLTRMGMNKPTYLEGTIAGGIFDAVNK